MWECECWNELAGRIGAHMATAVGEGVWNLWGLIYWSKEALLGIQCCREERTGIRLSSQISSGTGSPLMMLLHCHSGTLWSSPYLFEGTWISTIYGGRSTSSALWLVCLFSIPCGLPLMPVKYFSKIWWFFCGCWILSQRSNIWNYSKASRELCWCLRISLAGNCC